MFSIRLEGDTRRLLNQLRGYSALDKKNLNATIGENLRTSTLNRFKLGKSPSGKRWATSIRAAQEGGKTLIKTSALRNSIQAQTDASGVAVGTNVEYAATHQYGDKGRTIRATRSKSLRFRIGNRWISKKAVRIKITARPYLGISEDDMIEIKGTVEDFMKAGDT